MKGYVFYIQEPFPPPLFFFFFYFLSFSVKGIKFNLTYLCI